MDLNFKTITGPVSIPWDRIVSMQVFSEKDTHRLKIYYLNPDAKVFEDRKIQAVMYLVNAIDIVNVYQQYSNYGYAN